MAIKLEFLVAKEKMLVALATVSVAISSPDNKKKLFTVIFIYVEPCLICDLASWYPQDWNSICN